MIVQKQLAILLKLKHNFDIFAKSPGFTEKIKA